MSAAAVAEERERMNPAGGFRKTWTDLNAAFHFGKTSVDRASYHMLHLYRTNLEVRLQSIDEASLQSDNQKKIFATVVEMLKTPNQARANARGVEWDEIYKAERLMALLFAGPQLREEISVRLQELSAENIKDAEALRRDYESLLKPPTGGAAPDDAMLRSFLLRVMETLHWNAKKKYLARPIRKEATKIILNCVLISFLLVIAPYVLLNFFWATGGEVGKWWSLFALYTALAAGLLGAFFSRLITVQRHWSDMTLDEVFLHRELSYTLLRAGVGMCGALIVYFFLRSQFLVGPLFPKFEDIAIQFVRIASNDAVNMTFVMPSNALALLTFWCFLAGFSEALVPSILASTERQISEASAAPVKSGS